MEDRQTQIREGAGLEESKLNVEFIDWLRRWSTPLLLLVAVAALGYLGYQKWQQMKVAKVNEAFAELNRAVNSRNPNPEALKAIAAQYEGIRAVPTLALLRAADLHLAAARTGVKAAAPVQPDGTVAPEDVLNDEQRSRELAEAERLYRQVLDRNAGSTATALHAIAGAYGLAAVAESRGELDKAREFYERVKSLAEAAGFAEHVKVAQGRIELLPSLTEKPRLYAQAELPKAPEPTPPPLPLGLPGATGETGSPSAGTPPGETGATGSTGEPTPPASQTGEPPPTGQPAEPPAPAAPTGQPESPPGTPK